MRPTFFSYSFPLVSIVQLSFCIMSLGNPNTSFVGGCIPVYYKMYYIPQELIDWELLQCFSDVPRLIFVKYGGDIWSDSCIVSLIRCLSYNSMYHIQCRTCFPPKNVICQNTFCDDPTVTQFLSILTLIFSALILN